MASITCGHCKSTHASVAEVAQCAWYEADAKYEYELEKAAERFWEEGPNGPADDPRERELWALEDMRRNQAYEVAVAPPGTIFD